MTEKSKKIYKVTRLKENEKEILNEAYKDYRKLFFYPFTGDMTDEIFIFGDFWLVRGEENRVFCVFPPMIPSFKNSLAYWEIHDLIGDEFENRLVMGYVGGNMGANSSSFAAILQGVKLAAAKSKSNVVFYTPVSFGADFKTLFENGFLLKGLRGLDNLVAHYIFYGEFSTEEKLYVEKYRAKITDTKEISKLCEKGFVGFALRNGEILFGEENRCDEK